MTETELTTVTAAAPELVRTKSQSFHRALPTGIVDTAPDPVGAPPPPTTPQVITVPAVPLAERPPLVQLAVGMLRWFGIGPGVVGPPIPPPHAPWLLQLAWVALRRIDYRLFNEHPIAAPEQTAVTAEGVVTGTIGATDPDGDVLRYRVGAGPANGTVVVHADGTYTYTPNTGFTGTDEFTVLVSDHTRWHLHLLSGFRGHRLAVPVQVAVPAADSDPVITDITVAPGTGDGKATITVRTGSGNGQVSVVVETTEPGRGTIEDHGDGTFTFTPDTEYAHTLAAGGNTDPAEVELIVRATDTDGDMVTRTLAVTVAPVNGIPTATPAAGSYDPETGTTTTKIVVSDPDDDPLTVTVINSGVAVVRVKGVEIGAGATSTFEHAAGESFVVEHSATPDPSGERIDIVLVTVDDGHGAVIETKLQYHVAYADLQPAITVEPLGQSSDGGSTFHVGTEDGNGVVTITYDIDPAKGTVRDNGDGTFTFTPDAGFAHQLGAGATGSVEIVFSATDADGDVASLSAVAEVHGVNTDPVVVIGQGARDPETGTTTATVQITDGDRDDLTVTIINTGAGSVTYGNLIVRPGEAMTVTHPGGETLLQLVHTAAADPAGARVDTVLLTITDAHGGTAESTIQFAVPAAYVMPTIAVVQIGSPGDGAIDYQVSTTGGSGVIEVSADLGAHPHGTIKDLGDGLFRYTPNANFAHQLSFGGNTNPVEVGLVFTATDEVGSTAAVADTWSVTPQNAHPIITVVSTPGVLGLLQPVHVITIVDPDGDALRFRIGGIEMGAEVFVNEMHFPRITNLASRMEEPVRIELRGVGLLGTVLGPVTITVEDEHGSIQVVNI